MQILPNLAESANNNPSLTAADITSLAASYIPPELAAAAQIQRVDTIEGARIVGKTPNAAKDYAGLIFPYFWPGSEYAREYRLRRDNPDLERKPDGSTKEKNKYLSPPGNGNLLYIPPGTPAAWLTDRAIPIVITEGEKKALALYRYYWGQGEKRLVIGLGGVWNWRGPVEKRIGHNGKTRNVAGVIPDFDRIEWEGREALIVFDVNVLTDKSVEAARRELAQEIQRRSAAPSWVNLPTGIAGVNGVDDLLARCGPDFFAGLLATVGTVGESWEPISEFGRFDLPAFPLDALPDWQRRYAEGLATATQTPPDLAAMLSIANCAAAIAGKIAVRVREDWIEPTNIYSLTGLDVGNRKTAVHDATKAPLEDLEARLIRDAQPKIAEAKLEYDMTAARLEHLKKAAAKEDDRQERARLIEEAKEIASELQDMRVPAVPKLIASGDITPEAIASNLADQGGCLFVSSDEGELFQLLAGRYGNGANFEIVLKSHTGGKIRVDRRGRSETIERATLTIGMTVQPDVLRGIAENPAFRARGLTARFLYTLPPSLVGRRNSTPEPLSEEAQREYGVRVKTLAALNKAEAEDGKTEPNVVNLSAEGRDYLVAFMEEIEPQLAEDGELRAIGDWANKLAGAVVRIAAVLHFAEKSFDPLSVREIPASAVKNAIKIGRYLIPHARAAYAQMGADPEIEDAKYVLRWIEKTKSAAESVFTRREAQNWNSAKFPKVTDLDPALKLLEAHGYVRAVETRRKDSRKYEINPRVWESEKLKIQIPKQSDTSDTSQKISEAALTNETPNVGSVGGFRDSDFAHTAHVNGRQHADVEVF
jgi:DNA-binding PadR family transcriptional regulator